MDLLEVKEEIRRQLKKKSRFVILGTSEFGLLRTKMVEAKDGLSLEIDGYYLEVQWNHWKFNDIIVL